MSAQAAVADAPARDPHLPALHRLGDFGAPTAPQDMASCGLDEQTLTGLVLKLGHAVARFTTEWLCKNLHLSQPLITELLEKLCFTGLMEQLWQTSQGSAHYKITDHGRERAQNVLEMCGYAGPARVSHEASAAMLRWQFATTPP